MTHRILIIEDTPSMAMLYLQFLQEAGFEAEHAQDGREAFARLAAKGFDAVVLDLHLPDMGGLEVLQHVHRHYTDTPVIIATAFGSIDGAVDAMRMGAFDFIMKPVPASRLVTTVKKAIEHRKMQTELSELRREIFQESYQDFIGNAPVMQAVFRQIEAVASSRASVFIKGESGTGKELVARAIHKASPRAPKPFVALNCAAIPRDLMESEIFGHVKGAFTGASSDRLGAAQSADGGTLFLDEICEMPLDLQAKMLRFIQSGTFSPLGSTGVKKVDIRIISATNRMVEREVEDGRFREDFYYRLHVIPIELPALREREEDISLLAHHFLKRYAEQEKKHFASFEQDALNMFLRYEWPGNVRQLENVIQQIVVMSDDAQTVTADMLPQGLREAVPLRPGGFTPFVVQPLWQVEKDTILKALKASNNDVPRAAAMLEVSPSTIYRKLQGLKLSGDSMFVGFHG